MRCRFCDSTNFESLVDFGLMPLANAYRDPADESPEARFPLHALVCCECGLVQVDHDVAPATMFSDYAFFSSYSRPWVEHCRAYVQSVTQRYGLDALSQVVEIASNDGCLLACFDGPQVLGVDPAANVAKTAVDAGVPTICEFFGEDVAGTLPPADLLVANNVLGHVPDLNDFVAGCWVTLAAQGVLTVEVPHLFRLLDHCEYDTIYHEHFSYFSLGTLCDLFHAHGLRVFDVESLPIHGGSLRLHVCHQFARRHTKPSVAYILDKEHALGVDDPHSPLYTNFAARVTHNSTAIKRWLGSNDAIGVGAPAKANTLLNAAGVTRSDLRFTTDSSPHKQGLVLPGSRIPIRAPDAILPDDTLFVLAWNWLDELRRQFPRHRMVVPIPELKEVP